MIFSTDDTGVIDPLRKVTAFITRDSDPQREVVVFRHPHGNVQLPAGTVEEGEAPAEAVVREVWEETGLKDVRLIADLGSREQVMRADERVVLRRTPLLQRPDPDSPETVAPFPTFLGLRRGLYVRILGLDEAGQYAQVAYEEFDGPVLDLQKPSRRVDGWVDCRSITAGVVRHFFHFTPTADTADSWVQQAEEWGHRFELYWAPLKAPAGLVPDLLPFQQAWVNEFREFLIG